MKKLLLTLLAIVACGLSVFANVKGDVNCDGYVTAADITELYNYLLNNDMTYYNTVDVNGDGNITAADVTFIYDILLGNYQPAEHEWVDLGLPSGTLWATMNVGANSPEEYGDYFAWGETTPKDWYDWSTYKWWNGGTDAYALTKYCNNSEFGYNGFTDNKTELDPEDDAATANWGPEWRMPSLAQIKELYMNCTWVWTTQNGINGRLFTASNGASLFLPATGDRWKGEFKNVGSWGYYWSRELFEYPNSAWSLYYITNETVGCNNVTRSYGFTVRAVRVP